MVREYQDPPLCHSSQLHGYLSPEWPREASKAQVLLGWLGLGILGCREICTNNDGSFACSCLDVNVFALSTVAGEEHTCVGEYLAATSRSLPLKPNATAI